MHRQRVEFTHYISPDGIIYDFHDIADTFTLNFGGMGMPPISYIRTRGPFQHGMTVIDYRLEPRNIQLLFRKQTGYRSDYWDARQTLLNVLRPNRQVIGSFGPGKLRQYLPGDKIYDIDVFFQEGLQFTRRDGETQDEYSITESVVFVADDPTFYDPRALCYTFDFAEQQSLIFPFTFPFTLGSSTSTDTMTFTYTGTWLTYPVISITGPVTTPTINNLSTGESITLDYTVGAGEVITISLYYGNKTVTSSIYGNIIGYASGDLATFHIAPDPEVEDGVNVLEMTGNTIDIGTTAFQVTFYTRYIGI